MKLNDLVNEVKDKSPEKPDVAQNLIGDWENIVLLYTPAGLMIFESESKVDKFLAENPGFFPADIPFVPILTLLPDLLHQLLVAFHILADMPGDLPAGFLAQESPALLDFGRTL